MVSATRRSSMASLCQLLCRALGAFGASQPVDPPALPWPQSCPPQWREHEKSMRCDGSKVWVVGSGRDPRWRSSRGSLPKLPAALRKHIAATPGAPVLLSARRVATLRLSAHTSHLSSPIDNTVIKPRKDE